VGIEGNEGADQLAKLGANSPFNIDEDISYHIKLAFELTGAKLKMISQKLVYQGIMEEKNTPVWKPAFHNLDIARHATMDRSGLMPSDAAIWKSIWSMDFRRPIHNFLWKIYHNAYMIGDHWRHIATLAHLANCPLCGVPESMEHILFECIIDAREYIWQRAIELWRMKYNETLHISYGSFLAVGLVHFKKNGNVLRGKSRFFRILVSESAFLIWKLRCERRITKSDDDAEFHSITEIHNRWVKIINVRLQLDCILTSKKLFKRKALSQSLVHDTWSGALLNENSLPDNWLTSRVLVGIEPFDRLGRNR
jgi:ribonuclease HI